ncbi:transposase, partial [Colwellia sp. BRX8-5]|nr:transposase [Colwellia sp. BRX8-5]
HRRHWIEQRIFTLSQVFAIDICAHAVMNNHLHLVLHVDSEKANNWTTLEVLSRWHKLFKGTLLTRQFQQEQSLTTLTPFEMEMVEETAQVYKQRLIDISWYMRALNEPIARQANKEDKC